MTSSNDKASEPPSTSADNKNTVSFLQTIQIESRDKTLHLSASKVSDLGEKNITNFISTDIEWIPLNRAEVSEEKNEDLINFFATLEEDDDVQNIYSNAEFAK